MSVLPAPAKMTAPRVPSLPENDSDQYSETLDRKALPPSSPKKRKATTPPSDSSQRPCTRPRLSPRVPEPRQPSFASPEPGSINATIREHCRSRLYVRPIAWTMNQPRLLGCQFVPCDLPEAPRKKVGEKTTEPQGDEAQQELLRIATVLQQPSGRLSKREAVKSLVRAYINTSLDLKKFNPAIPFSFGGRVVTHVHLDGVCSVDPKKAFFAFLHLETVESGRQRCLPKKPHQRANEPVDRLRDKKLRARQPSNAFEDPYIVAALTALAQAQRWFQTPSGKTAQPDSSGEVQPSSNSSAEKATQPGSCEEEQPSSNGLSLFTARLLLVTEVESRYLYMYEASFSTRFLDQLEKPSQFSSTDPVRISYYRLPSDDPEELIERFPGVLGLLHEQGERGTG